MSKAIAFLAGLGTGYMKAEDKKVEDARKAASDKREQELFDANMADRKRVSDDRDALRTAAAPVTVDPNMVKPETMDNRDVGQPGETLNQDGYKVGARRFATEGAAKEEVAAYNAPAATRARVMATLGAQGNVLGADQLRTSGLQADAAQMTLDKGKRDEAAAVFDMGVKEALQRGGPDALATFMSESHGDGQGGKLKFKAVTSPDGKWQMHKVGEDGASAPVGGTFTSDETGYATAGLMLARGVPEKDKAAHLLQVKQQSDSAAHNKAQLKIAQQNADTQEQYRKDQAENMRQQRALEDKRIAAAAKAIEVPPGVTWDKEADAFLRTRYTVKDADGNETVDGGGLLFAKQLSVALASRNGGDTTAALGAAFQADNKLKQEAGGDPEKLRIGRLQRLQSLMAPQSAAPAAPAATKTVAPAAASGQNQANVPKATTAPPTTPAAVAAQGVGGPAAVDPRKAEIMAPLNAQVEQASAVMRAVANSGDQAAIQKYAAVLEQARAARRTRAVSLFGPQEADQYLTTLPL